MEISRCDNWTQIKHHLGQLSNFQLKYSNLSDIIHRISNLEDRYKTAIYLKPLIYDTGDQYFLFIQSMATIEERTTISNIIPPPF